MFTPGEADKISPYFTNLDRPVFALVNLPETVKGALFARYSRSAKSLRRLFLDEFLDETAGLAPPKPRSGEGGPPVQSATGSARAERLYQRVLSEYGDDSVAQLGGVHLAVEDASNLLTKVLERGRLMAYLEQSTRYIPYTDRRGDAWRYHVPAELDGHPLRDHFAGVMNETFETYARWIDPMREWFERRYPKAATDSDAVYRQAARAAAGGDAVERRDFRDGAGLRSAVAADARASARRSARHRRRDARRAAQGDSGVPHPRRSARSWRSMDGVLRGDARRDDRLGQAARVGRAAFASRRGDAHGLRRRRRAQGRRRRALHVVVSCRR
jgi:thymidylate synthase ThyX